MRRQKYLEFEEYTMQPLIPDDPIEDEAINIEDMLKIAINSAIVPNEEELKKRAKSFSPYFKIPRNLTYMNIFSLKELPKDVNYFPNSDGAEFSMLVESIESQGIIEPIIVWEHKDDSRDYIVCGQSRVFALQYIYNRTKDERFLTVPCYFLAEDELDDYKVKCLIIDTNLHYRTIPLYIKVYAIIERYEIMKATKQYRNEYNIAVEMEKDLGISKSTIFPYIRLRNLHPRLIHALAEMKIKLKTAMKLASRSMEFQELLLSKYGLDVINDDFVMFFLANRDETEEELDAHYKRVIDNCYHGTVSISLKIKSTHAHMIFEAMKNALLQMVKDYKNSFDKSFFSFRCTENLRNIDEMDKINACLEILKERDLEVLKQALC